MESVFLAAFCILSSFFVTFVLTKFWIRVARKAKLVGQDMNKFAKPKVAEADDNYLESSPYG